MNTIDNLYSTNYEQYIKIDKSTISGKNKIIDTLRMDLMVKELFKELNNVEVRKSNIHGNGVFAKKDINIDEIITFYPVDILYLNVGENETVMSFSKRYKQLYSDDLISNIKSNYRYYIDENINIVGDPIFFNNPNYLGHLINDSMNHNKTKKSRNKYISQSQLKSNCDFISNTPFLYITVVSNKFIKKDEELFVSYGVQYWDNIN
jgi:hypothetical protein